MAARKKLTKNQLRDDKFVDTVAHYAGILRGNLNYALGGVVLLVVVVAAIYMGVSYNRGADAGSRLAFSQALKGLETAMASGSEEDYESLKATFEGIAEEHGGRDAGRWALYYIGYCKEQMKDFIGAEADYRAYLDKDGRDGEFAMAARQGLASCYYGQNKPRAAAEMLEELAAEPGIAEAQRLDWLYRAGQAYFHGRYYEDAQRVLESLLPEAEGILLTRTERDLEALKALRAS